MRQEFKNLVFGMLGGVIVIGLFLVLSPKNNSTADSNHSDELRTEVQPDKLKVYNTAFAASPQDISFVEAAENSVNAVVHIRTEISKKANSYDDFFGSIHQYLYGNPHQGAMRNVVGFGSGVVLSQDGYIVTNNHVVDGADKIEVTFNDKRKMVATIVGSDPNTDIALIRVKSTNLPFLVFGNSDDVKVGEWVLAVGNPFNLTSTVTAGIVSAKARNINILGNNSSVDSFIQTDAVINRGNSGGALVNTSGELIGINAAIASQTGVYEGYSFAIPANIARKVVDDIIQFGEPQRAYMGVEIREMTEELAKQAGEKAINGVYINRVVDNGGAKDAGIEAGDVILEVNSKTVNSLSQLLEIVGQYRPGDKVDVLALRDGKTKMYKVELRNQEGNIAFIKSEDNFYIKELGATLERISTSDRSKLNISYGLKVVNIEEGVLMRGGIGKNFIILLINGKKVDNQAEIESALSKGNEKTIRVQGMYPNGMKISFEFLN